MSNADDDLMNAVTITQDGDEVRIAVKVQAEFCLPTSELMERGRPRSRYTAELILQRLLAEIPDLRSALVRRLDASLRRPCNM